MKIFIKCDWPTQIFRRKKTLKLKIFNLTFSENFLFVENFFEWKCAFMEKFCDSQVRQDIRWLEIFGELFVWVSKRLQDIDIFNNLRVMMILRLSNFTTSS